MAFTFQCRTCGDTHKGLPSFGPDAPDSYAAMTLKDQQANASLGSDNCIISNQHFFVRGQLELPIVDTDDVFVWLVWCSLSLENYLSWEDHFHVAKRAQIGPFFGGLNTWLPFYERTLDLPISVHLRDDGRRPFIEVTDPNHLLFAQQRDGIPMRDVENIVHDLLHPAP